MMSGSERPVSTNPRAVQIIVGRDPSPHQERRVRVGATHVACVLRVGMAMSLCLGGRSLVTMMSVMLLAGISRAEHQCSHQTECIKHVSTPLLILRLE